MYGEAAIDIVAREWLLIDCSQQGEVRLARAKPSPTPDIDHQLRYESSIPTFTDVLLRYAETSGHPLERFQPVVAIAGVPTSGATVIERSRWIISRDGLTSLFGVAPVILNEVAAQAWTLKESLYGVTQVHGPSMPDLARRGRFAFLTYGEGVGTAVLDVDDRGNFTVLDAEGGQLDFAPISEAERDLAGLVVKYADAAVSWEQVLMLRRDAKARGLADQDRLFARLLARFVSNLIYTTGAWSGAFMTGRLIPPPEILSAEFPPALTARRPYPRLLAKSGVFRVAQTDAVLRGCAAMMASRLTVRQKPEADEASFGPKCE
jgi:glucokinase